MDTTWLSLFERHVQVAGIVFIVGYILRNHGILVEARRRLNQLWWDRCARVQEQYTALGAVNGSVIPPPHSVKEQRNGDRDAPLSQL